MWIVFFCWLSEAGAVRAGLYTEDTAYCDFSPSSCQIKLCEQYIHICLLPFGTLDRTLRILIPSNARAPPSQYISCASPLICPFSRLPSNRNASNASKHVKYPLSKNACCAKGKHTFLLISVFQLIINPATVSASTFWVD
ncbi:hypothetical protein JOM56_009887 [Amanita muscaria]